MPSKQTKTWWMMSTFCKPVISNSAWPWRHPSLLYIIALDMKTLEVPKCTQHYYTWHESSWCSVILLLHQNCTSLDNSAYNKRQWLIRIQKNQIFHPTPWHAQIGIVRVWKYMPLSFNTQAYDPHRRLLYLFSYFTSALAQAFNLNTIIQ